MRISRLLWQKPAKYVSFRYAPSFREPEFNEVVGVPIKKIPKNCVPAFVIPDVVSEEEEQALLGFTDPWFSRLPYNDNHMDALIHHYKEFYRSYSELMGERGYIATQNVSSDMDEINTEVEKCGNKRDIESAPSIVQGVLKRCRGLASKYLTNIPIDDRVHFLKLSGNGFIRSHVDESRNSSGIIAGLNLGSGRVMTLTHPKHPGERVELLLAPRAFYIMIGTARYEWEHSTDWVKDDDEHIKRVQKSLVVEGTPLVFDGEKTPFTRGDRTAVIFRGVSPMELLLSKMQGKRAQS